MALSKEDIIVMMENLSTVAKTAGLRINANESKNMRIKNRNLGQMKIRELQTEKGAVFFFKFGAVTSARMGTTEKETSRIGLAAAASRTIDTVWRSTAQKTNVNIYKSCLLGASL